MKLFILLTPRRRLGLNTIFLLLAMIVLGAGAAAQTIPLGEAVDNTALTWTTGGDENWFGQTLVSFYGGDAAQSGDVDDNQESWIQTTVTGPGVLSFYWKVSSSRERTHLVFVVDSTAKASCRADRNWELASVAIPSGSHALRWIYEPFSSGDAGFLDKVEFISGPAIVVNYPNDGATCSQRNFCDIRWAASEDIPSVRVEFEVDGFVKTGEGP